MSLTSDPNDPRLTRGIDTTPRPQNETYLVLPEAELVKEFVRPVRKSYKHSKCGMITFMGQKLSETYARDPKFYGSTYCYHCQMHKPVEEFVWEGTNEVVGS